MSADTPPPRILEARAKLSSHFSDFKDEKYGEGWSALWEKGDYLPWDKGFPSPALIDTLAQRRDLLGLALLSDGKRKKALVPGCGRGVDVLLLASFGYDAYGLEYSEEAVEQCKKLLKEHGDDEMYRVKDQQVGKGDVVFVRGDFYGDGFLEDMGVREGKFDLIYDYTVRSFSACRTLTS
jgi:SAM-dependent methyltransferase